MAKRFDICTPRPGKEGKTFWTRIGTAWQNDKGIQLVFDALPLPDAEGRCVANLFEPREGTARSASNDRADARERANGSQGHGSAYSDALNDEVPFLTMNSIW